MHTGMLWFDNDKSKSLEEKVQGGVDYYVKKYGRQPDLVMVHPSMLENGNVRSMTIGPLTIRAYRPVLPGHIWIGIEDK